MLSDRIRNLRLERNNMTQEELAKELNISQSTITMIETNKRMASRELIIKIANFFNCSTDYLLGNSNNKNTNINAIPIGPQIRIPVIGTVKAGLNGIAYEEHLGFESVEKKDINGGNYFYLRVKGDSMINESILPGDYVLVREQNDVEYGELAIAIIDGEEGTLKRVYKQPGSIMLQASNQAYPPRIFIGEEMEQVRIIGKVKEIKRKL